MNEHQDNSSAGSASIGTLLKTVGLFLFYIPGLAGFATIWTSNSSILGKLFKSAAIIVIYYLVMRWLNKQNRAKRYKQNDPVQKNQTSRHDVVVDDKGNRILVVDPQAIPKQHLEGASRSKFAPFLEKLTAEMQEENKRRQKQGLPEYKSLEAYQKDRPPDQTSK